MAHDWIAVRGARVHNLKNIDVDIPRQKLVVITGLSGSGKSSLAFDTIYAEGQRRYVESLSAYARQFLEQMEKPDVDLIDGLSPAISIEQKTTGSNPRSTVGTVTEIYDYLRLVFANIGVPHCPNCGKEITSQSLERIADMVMLYPQDERINVLAPIARGRKGEFKKELAALRQRGYTKARIDGQFRSLEEDIKLDRRRNHTIEVVVDRLIVRGGIERRLTESIDVALGLADDLVVINTHDGGGWAEQSELEQFRTLRPCAACRGQRLKQQSLSVKVKGRTISDYVSLPISEALDVFDGLELTDREAIIAERILREIQERLRFLTDVGVGYLTLGRSAATLSGGEGQRIRLATQIGANLTGVLYVLDEPSIGLHQRDNRKLLGTLSRLRDLGNTVIVVEHDEETIRTADYVIDLGPGAGEHGGHVIFQGTPHELLETPDKSITGAYLTGAG